MGRKDIKLSYMPFDSHHKIEWKKKKETRLCLA